MYINWLHMARAGLLALQYYTPGKEGMTGWGQAHMMARYAILQVGIHSD
jgi:dipeptidyl-peptidase-3